MTTIRKIVTSKIDGDSANNTSNSEVRPFGEMAVYIDTENNGGLNKLELLMFDGVRTHLRSKVLSKGTFYGGDADSGSQGDGIENFDTIKLIPDAELHYNDSDYGNDQYIVIDPTFPNHIHVRAGGAIDSSTAILFLGGEENHVSVSDSADQVEIRTNDTHTWLFGTDGSLSLPSGGTIDETAGIKLTPAGGTNATQALIIYPTAADGNHIHLAAAFGGNTELYLGTDNHYVKLVDGGNVEVRASTANLSATAAWTFGTDGGLTLPGDLHGAEVFLSGEQPEPIVIGHTLNITPAPNASDKKFGFRIDQSDGVYLDSYLDMPTAENNKHVSISFALTDAIGPDSIGYIWNQGTDTNVTNLNNAFNIFANNTNIKLTTQGSDNNQSTWTFGTDGNLTMPGNLVIAGNANVFGTNRALIQPADDLPLIALSSGANGAVSSVWVEDIGNVGTSNIAAVYANPTVGSGIVRIVVGQNGGNAGPNLWDFNANGTITLPASSGQIGRSGYTNGIDLYNDNGGSGYVRMNYADESVVWADPAGAHVQTTGGTWDFGTDGNLTLPQTNMNSSPAPASLPGITWTDGTFQTGRTINIPEDVQSMQLAFTSMMYGSSNLQIRNNGIKTSTQSISLETGNNSYFDFEGTYKRITFSDSYGSIIFGTETRNQTGHSNDIEIKSYSDGTNGNVYISAGGNPTGNRWTFNPNGTLVVPGALQNTNYFEIKSGTVSNNTWNLGVDGSTVFPNNTLKGYCFTATNVVTNYIPQSSQFMYSDSPILGQISSIGGTWYIKGPGLVGWKQITAVQDNSGVALIVRIGSGSTPLSDGSEFPSGGGNVYTISQ